MDTALRTFLLLASFLFSSSLLAQELGKASYYSNEFDGGRTYFGETYDKDQYTAAHKVHPQGTRLKVTRIDNGKSVVVRINDRGPYISGRIIELSYAAARALDMIDQGVIDVRVEVMSKGTGTGPESQPTTDDQASRQTEKTNATPPSSNTSKPATNRDTNRKGTADPPITDNRNPAINNVPPPAKSSNQSPTPTNELVRGYQPFGLFDIEIRKVAPTGFGVQVASFSSYENTLKKVTDLQGQWFEDIIVSVEKAGGNKQYKVILGPFPSREKAKNYLTSLRKNKKGIDGFVVDLSSFEYQ